MTLDIIKWRKIIHVANSNKLILRFHITSQNFGTKNCGLKNVVKTRVYNIHKAKNVFGSMFLITYFSMWKNINIILQLKYVLEFVKGVENFAMGNCSLKWVTRVCPNSIQVLTDFGAVLDFKGSIKAWDILDDHLGYGIFQQGLHHHCKTLSA